MAKKRSVRHSNNTSINVASNEVKNRKQKGNNK